MGGKKQLYALSGNSVEHIDILKKVKSKGLHRDGTHCHKKSAERIY